MKSKDTVYLKRSEKRKGRYCCNLLELLITLVKVLTLTANPHGPKFDQFCTSTNMMNMREK